MKNCSASQEIQILFWKKPSKRLKVKFRNETFVLLMALFKKR